MRAPEKVAVTRPVHERSGVEIEDEGVVRRGRDHGLLEGIGLDHLGLRQDLFGDIGHRADQAHELPVFEHRAPPRVEPSHLAVTGAEDPVAEPDGLVASHGGHGLVDQLPVVGMHP